MSEFKVEVVEVGAIEKHPNADNLSLTKVRDYPVILRTGDFQPGYRAVYVPVDAVVPNDSPRFAFLGEHRRIKAKRLRGIFSMGLLVKADEEWIVGQDVAALLGIEKYEPPEPASMGGDNEKDPGFLPVYTDIEGLRRWPEVLIPGEQVVLTEKIHGANGRFLFHEGRLWVGSHKNIKREDANIMWWKIAGQYGLSGKLSTAPCIALYGEIYGQVQDLKYGVKAGFRLAFFDALDVATRTYLGFDAFSALVARLGLDAVPVIHRGPWVPGLAAQAEGNSLVAGAANLREGFVVRPVVERFDEKIGRVILKMPGEGYLTRKEK